MICRDTKIQAKYGPLYEADEGITNSGSIVPKRTIKPQKCQKCFLALRNQDHGDHGTIGKCTDTGLLLYWFFTELRKEGESDRCSILLVDKVTPHGIAVDLHHSVELYHTLMQPWDDAELAQYVMHTFFNHVNPREAFLRRRTSSDQ